MILLLVRSLESGGSERQLVELAKGLHARRCTVAVATFYKRGPLLSELEQKGVSVIDLRKRGRWDVVGFLLRTLLLLRRLKPDVLYSFLGGANLVAASMRPFVSHTKLVWSIRSSTMDLSKYDWLHRVAYWLECRLSRAPDLIISNSHAGSDFAVTNGFPPERIVVIPNGIDTDRFTPDSARRRTQRAAWGLAEDDVAVGVVARLDPMKGHEPFLDAAARSATTYPELRFFLIGEGPEGRALKQHAASLGLLHAVRFLGATDFPEDSLNALDIYCSPSLTEAFSNSIAEAMACGVPCVVTDVGDSSTIVGELGLVVPSADVASLAQAICSARRRLEELRRPDLRRRIVQIYSVEVMVQRTIEALRNPAIAS